MNIADQIKWINENEEWIKSFNPYSIDISELKGVVSIHARNQAEATKKYFKDNVKEAYANWCDGNSFNCSVLGKAVDISAIFTEEEVKEIGFENFGMPF